MTKEPLQELVEAGTAYSIEMRNTMREALHPALPKTYFRGVLDGVENTAYVAYMKGAKDMYNKLMSMKNEQTD